MPLAAILNAFIFVWGIVFFSAASNRFWSVWKVTEIWAGMGLKMSLKKDKKLNGKKWWKVVGMWWKCSNFER